MDHDEFCKFVSTNLRHNLGVVPNLIIVHTEKHRAGTDFQLKVDGLPEVVGETQAENAIEHLCGSCNLPLESSWANSMGLELKLTCNDSLSCRSVL